MPGLEFILASWRPGWQFIRGIPVEFILTDQLLKIANQVIQAFERGDLIWDDYAPSICSPDCSDQEELRDDEYLGEMIRFQLSCGEKEVGWAIIEHHSPLLDFEFILVEVFDNIEEMRQYMKKNYSVYTPF